MRTLSVSLSLPSPKLSPNARTHWRSMAKHKAQARADAKILTLAAMQASKLKFPFGKCEVRMVWYMGGAQSGYKPRDKQNAIASLKYALDGCIEAGVLPDDSHRWLDFGPVTFLRTKKEHGGRSAVVLVFTELNNNEGNHHG